MTAASALDAAVGRSWRGPDFSWTSTDAILYALAVGAGHGDLSYVTENSSGVDQQVLPTFPVIMVAQDDRAYGGADFADVLHAEQRVELAGPLPVDGTAAVDTRIIGVYDKGRDAQIVSESTVLSDDRPLARLRSSVFVRGGGGFGGERGTSDAWARPERPADVVRHFVISEDQALLYRLNGDRNPLHSDPVAAAEAGFSRPILHGLCTFGIAGRILLDCVCAGDLTRFASIEARFSRPVLPGQTLEVHVWLDDAEAVFQVLVDDQVVLDRGRVGVRP